MILLVVLVTLNICVNVHASSQIGVGQISSYRYGVLSHSHNATGVRRVLVVLVEFQDVKRTKSLSEVKSIVVDQVNAYYSQVSYGKLSITGQVYGWYTLNRPLSYYGQDQGSTIDVNSDLLASDALSYVPASAQGFDFLMVVHAGNDQASSESSNDIWSSCSCAVFPHYNPFPPVSSGSWSFSSYALLSEFNGVGTFAHEFGHYLGLPDLYDTTTGNSYVGYWSLMDSGNACCSGTSEQTPSYIGAWGAALLGWLYPRVVQNSVAVAAFTLKPLESSAASALLIPLSPSTYFFVEYRVQSGYDKQLSTSGVLVYFVDEQLDTGRGIVRLVNRVTGLLLLEGPPNSFDSAAFSDGAEFNDVVDNTYLAFLQSGGSFTTLYSTKPITSTVFSTSNLVASPQFMGMYDGLVTLSGALVDANGAGLDGQTVEIMFLDASSDSWQSLGSTTTADGGKFSFEIETNHDVGDYQFQFVYPGGNIGNAWYVSSFSDFSVRILPGEMKIRISYPGVTTGDVPVWLSVADGQGRPLSGVRLIVDVNGARQAMVISDNDGRASFVLHIGMGQIGSTLEIQVKADRVNYATAQGSATTIVSPPTWLVALVIALVALFGAAVWEFKGRMNQDSQTLRLPTRKGYPRTGLVCPTCHHINRPGARYCVRDRTRLARYPVFVKVCPSCSFRNAAGTAYCIDCGARMP